MSAEKNIPVETLRCLMLDARNQANKIWLASRESVDENELYLELLTGKINVFFSGEENLRAAWKAWLDHIGYFESDCAFEYFVSQWKADVKSPQGAWVEAWLGGAKSVG